MKKYLHLLFVALFATMSFALTSCGDDDDEPDGGNDTKAALTINGQGYGIHPTTGATPTFSDNGTRLGSKIDLELYPAGSEETNFMPCVHVCIYAESETLTKGMTLTLTEGYVEMVTDVMQGDKYDEIKNGKISVAEVKGSSVTLKFDNLKLTDEDNKTVTINGSIVCEYTKN